MSAKSGKLLFWSPRVLSILFILFLSLFSLDVFSEGLGFWPTMGALALHLVPSLLLCAVLIAAWKWEWIGASLYALAGVLYIYWATTTSRAVPLGVRGIWMATIAGPALLIALLFLMNWRKHDELRLLLR